MNDRPGCGSNNLLVQIAAGGRRAQDLCNQPAQLIVCCLSCNLQNRMHVEIRNSATEHHLQMLRMAQPELDIGDTGGLEFCNGIRGGGMRGGTQSRRQLVESLFRYCGEQGFLVLKMPIGGAVTDTRAARHFTQTELPDSGFRNELERGSDQGVAQVPMVILTPATTS